MISLTDLIKKITKKKPVKKTGQSFVPKNNRDAISQELFSLRYNTLSLGQKEDVDDTIDNLKHTHQGRSLLPFPNE